jgi:hypothetical protein
MAKLTTKKLVIYYIYFQVEKVVEEEWIRPEDEYIQDFGEMEDTLSQEMGDIEEKNQRNEESEEIDKGPHIQASEQTRKALEARAEEIKKQNDLDVIGLARKKAVAPSNETNKTQKMRAGAAEQAEGEKE